MSNARNLANLMGTNTLVPQSKVNLSLGASDLPTGSVLQVKESIVTVQDASTTSITNNSGPAALYGTGISNRTYGLAATVNITPTSTSSKLVCMATINWSAPAVSTTTGAIVGIVTLNDTSSFQAGDYPFYGYNNTLGTGYAPPMSFEGVFSPASTSQQTIRLRPGAYSEGNNTFTCRYKGHSLIVMEVA